MSVENNQEILEQEAEVWNACRQENPGVIPDFSGEDLSELNMARVNLSDADLSQAELFDSVLEQANLKMANLTGAEVPISDIANEWGFWHMGQFAADYRRQFSELPSETARRDAGP